MRKLKIKHEAKLPLLALSILFFREILISGTNTYINSVSPKIRTESHLESVLEKEKKLQGISDYNVEAYFSNSPNSFCKKNEDSYEIFLNSRNRNVNAVKHEVRHIAKGHAEDKLKGLGGFLKYNFYYEPQTILYVLKNMEKKSL